MKKSGILMPVTSLPSEYGIGCFDKCAYEFVDFLSESGQTLWQVLPFGHTGFGDSPYQCFSAFAGNPYMIDLNKLIEGGLLTKEECRNLSPETQNIDYEKVYNSRYPLLKKAYSRCSLTHDENYKAFVNENAYWLDDYSLFMSLKGHFDNRMWQDWDDAIKKRKDIEKYREILKEEIGFWNFVQYHFYIQWNSLKDYANKKGIRIIGDMPIYVSSDSADIWAEPSLFAVDDNLKPTHVAGCPPDGFSSKGQLWGNPIYNWKEHERTGFEWWTKRIKHSFKLFDILRIDHFRGFDEFYSIPAEHTDATRGRWEKAPGYELFETIKKNLGHCPIIAEDLGFITPSVKELLKKTGFAGIKILEFAFDRRNGNISNDHIPHNYPQNCVAYTGTHDNEPIASWFMELDYNAKQNVRKYIHDMDTPDCEIYRKLICETMKSPADTVIFPIWDVLGLGKSARLNTPGTTGTNWTWRLPPNSLTQEVKNFLKDITVKYERK